MPDSYPLVTVVTLVYNTGKWMPDTLNSIKAQTYPNIEHIIIDDCSKDDSVEIVTKWIAENNYVCTYIKHENNVGICKSSNESIALAKGKYTVGIGDDIMLPDKIMNDVLFMEARPKAGFVHSRAILRLTASNEEMPVYFDKKYEKGGFNDLLSGRLNVCTPTVMYRSSAFDEVGMFDENLYFEDTDMLLRIASRFEVGYRKFFSIIYCRRTTNLSDTNAERITGDIFTILQKWRHVPNYRWHVVYRHQSAFYYYAPFNKTQALKHLGPSLKAFWRRELYSGMYHFIFKWKGR